MGGDQTMNPQLPPGMGRMGPVFYPATAPQAADIINRHLSDSLKSLRVSQRGVMIEFEIRDEKPAETILIIGGQIPIFKGQPREVAPGQMEIEADLELTVAICAYSQYRLEQLYNLRVIDPRLWTEWPDAAPIIGMSLTGYSPGHTSNMPGVNQDRVPNAMLEFNVDYCLIVTPISFYITMNAESRKPS